MKYYVLIIFFWLIHINVYAQISHSITFDSNKLKLKDRILEGGSVYIELEYEDCLISDNVGQPAIPYKYLHFIVPNEPAGFSITVNDSVSEIISLSAPLLPVQQPIPVSINSSSYQLNLGNFSATQLTEIYPKDIIRIVDEGYFDGDKRILTVRVSPIRYDIFLKKLHFYSFVNFTINYENKSVKNKITKSLPIHSVNALENRDLLNQLSFLENKLDVNKLSRKVQATTVEVGLPTYEYVVITSESLAPYFKRLVDWKRQKGLNAGIVTMQEILNNPSIVKDEVSNLSDDAGKLRQYLRLAYQNGTKYVLLGGGKSVVPIRYGYGNYYGIIDQIPTDWYYSDLNGNWNKNGNDNYGEEAVGEIDYYPELYVGRLMCKNEEEINNYIDKLFIYEQNPGKGDYNYLKREFYTQADQLQSGRQANIIAENLKDILFDYTILEEYPGSYDENPTFPTGKDIIDAMNQRYYGFISWFNHGSPCGLASMNKRYDSGGDYRNFIGIEDEVCYGIREEKGNGLSNLNNFDYPSIGYTIACDVAPFDTLVTSWAIYDVKYNIAESMTVVGKYGCAAFLGNTRSGWVSTSYILEQKFINKLKQNFGKVGVAEALSKADYKSHWLTLTHNLIGCPEFEMWTDIPSQFVNASINKSGNNLTVNSMIDDTNIALKGLFSSDNVTLKTGSNCTFTDIPKNYLVTLYKHDYLPYIYPIYLQNESVTGTYYLKGNKMYLGNHVDNTKDIGNFVIKSGADIILDVSDELILDAGTEIELGATFEVNIK